MTWRWRRRERREAELDEEIAHDLRLDADERMDSGMSPTEADQASRRDFGNLQLIKEETRATWTYGVMVMRLAQGAYDIRHAVRRLAHAPTFTLTALAVLALGMAANVVVFSIANAVLLRPLALPDADRIVVFQTISPTGADASASPVMYAHWRQQTLLGAVVFVLLIACSNIANLLLLQGASRRREMAVRAAIGAGRGRIVRQLLTESLLLSCSGGALGLALGWIVMRFVLSMGLSGQSGLPRLNDVTSVSLDWRVIAFTVTVSIATGALFGLAPALRVSRVDLSAATKAADERSSRGPGRRRAESVLVVLQVSLALVLLIGSALFMRTVVALTRVDAGFDPDHVLTLRASLGGPEFAATSQADVIVRRGIAALGAVPGVAIVGAAYGVPLEGGGGLPFEIVGRPLPAGQTYHGGAAWQAISPGYFEALRIPLLRGRDFTANDGQQSPAVTVVNDVMARQNWPHEDPLGKHVVMGHGVGPQFQDEPVREIVGIAGSIRENRLDRQPGAEMYEPLAQLPDVANMRLTVVGAMVGVLAALALTRAIAGLLFNVRAWDPSTFIAVPIVVATVAGLAVWLPARRASRVDPMLALRSE